MSGAVDRIALASVGGQPEVVLLRDQDVVPALPRRLLLLLLLQHFLLLLLLVVLHTSLLKFLKVMLGSGASAATFATRSLWSLAATPTTSLRSKQSWNAGNDQGLALLRFFGQGRLLSGNEPVSKKSLGCASEAGRSGALMPREASIASLWSQRPWLWSFSQEGRGG